MRRPRLTELLRPIRADAPLAEIDADDLGDDWPVRSLYRQPLSVHDVAETTATRLLARKRPHIVPILTRS